MAEPVRTYLSVAFAWSAYLALHSAMISITVTDYLRSILGDRFRFYRLFFNLVAIATLIPLVRYTTGVKGEMLFAWDGTLVVVKWAMLAVGAMLFVAGSLHYDMWQFLGLRQLRAGASQALINTSGTLDDTGVLGAIRHPYYTATILLFWSHDIDTTALVVNVVVTVYVVIGTWLEERKLCLELGETYRDYQARVSMFVPWKWLNARLGGAWVGAVIRLVTALAGGLVMFAAWLVIVLSRMPRPPVPPSFAVTLLAPVVAAAGFGAGMLAGERLTHRRQPDARGAFLWPLAGGTFGTVVMFPFGGMMAGFGLFGFAAAALLAREVRLTRASRR